MLLAIDPGNIESAYVLMDYECKPIRLAKEVNEKALRILDDSRIKEVRIEMIASYGMPVGYEVFETCLFIGRIIQRCIDLKLNYELIYRKEVKVNLCGTTKAKDSNVTQALVDRFARGQNNKGKGTKKEPGWFYGFKKDIWQAYAVGVTAIDRMKEVES